MKNLTISHAQQYQPWTVPYSETVLNSEVPHILGSHAVLHAMKSLGKTAAVFEALDHSKNTITEAQREVIRAMSADLITVALRLGNLYNLDMAAALVDRVEEKNNIEYPTTEEKDNDL